MIELLVGEVQPRETNKAITACNDYLRMGAGRSLGKLLERYLSATESPTKRKKTLADWSRNYGWVERAAVYDAGVDTAKTEAAKQEMQSGLALAHERVNSLKWLEGKLREELELGLWFKDIKMSAKGDTVDVEVFKGQVVAQYRGVLDDIAKETGGRKPKDDILKFLDLSKLSGEQLERLAAGEDVLNVVLG